MLINCEMRFLLGGYDHHLDFMNDHCYLVDFQNKKLNKFVTQQKISHFYVLYAPKKRVKIFYQTGIVKN